MFMKKRGEHDQLVYLFAYKRGTPKCVSVFMETNHAWQTYTGKRKQKNTIFRKFDQKINIKRG